MKLEYSVQYNSNCIAIELGDTSERVIKECLDNGAICTLEGDVDFVVRFPDRPQEVYSLEALERSLRSLQTQPDSGAK